MSNFARCLVSDIIELTARGQSRFLVHKDILTSQSQPFRNAVSGVWKESTERKIDLHDWDRDTVGCLVEFLYTGNYSYPDPDPASAVVSDRTPPPPPPAAVRARGLRDRSPDESSRSRPLTPLEQCLPRCLPENRETDVERLSGFAPEHHEYREPLLTHAAVYALACYKDVRALQCLALQRLVMTLGAISPVRADARLPPGIVDVVRYVYAHTDALRSSEEPLRRVMAQFAALNFPALQTRPEFAELLAEGGDFVNDLMAKVSRRLVAAEKGLGVSVGSAAAPRRFVARIRILYSIQPNDCIQELNGGSSDINHRRPSCLPRLGGQSLYHTTSVYLVPEYTVLAKDACTEFQISIQSARDASKFDLGKNEDTGMFRYLVPVKDSNVSEKITEVALWGTEGRVKNVACVGDGRFDGMTVDINTHRNEGYYLYLVWKAVETE